MKKTQKLRKSSFKIGDQIITYYIDPTLDLSEFRDSPVYKKKMANANETLKNSIFPSEMRSLFPPGIGLKFSDEIVK
jgi:hypothetical protein